jgi:hypothetical protein
VNQLIETAQKEQIRGRCQDKEKKVNVDLKGKVEGTVTYASSVIDISCMPVGEWTMANPVTDV